MGRGMFFRNAYYDICGFRRKLGDYVKTKNGVVRLMQCQHMGGMFFRNAYYDTWTFST